MIMRMSVPGWRWSRYRGPERRADVAGECDIQAGSAMIPLLSVIPMADRRLALGDQDLEKPGFQDTFTVDDSRMPTLCMQRPRHVVAQYSL